MRVGGLEYTQSPACSALWQTSTLHLQTPVIPKEGWHKKSCKRLASTCSHLPDSLPVRSVPWALEPVAWQCPLSTPGAHTPCWGLWLLVSATVAGLCRVQSYVVALQVVTTVPPPYLALLGFQISPVRCVALYYASPTVFSNKTQILQENSFPCLKMCIA